MPLSALIQTGSVVESSRRAFQANRAIIVIGNTISALARESSKALFPDLIIYDVNTLAFLVAKHPDLIDSFEEITREALTFSEIVEPKPTEANIEKDIAGFPMAPVAQADLIEPTRGSILCTEIHAIPTGRSHAKKFEEKIMEALRYIFEKDLTAWSPQKSSDTRLSFYDLVARVASEHDFWNTIVNQFRSRYIVFEFKNYVDKIKQGQIYTTEKYLFGPALRSTAIIISRNGADTNALAAARGALRESGKLMVNLNIKQLCEMLHLKDNGDDHNTILVATVDDMLMRLER
jgi:hypothetical protein